MKQQKQETQPPSSEERGGQEFNVDWVRLGIGIAGMVVIILISNFYC